MNISDCALTHLVCKRYYSLAEKENDYADKPRPFFTFAYIVEGSLKCVTDTYTVTASKGDILFIPYKIKYRLFWQGKSEIYSCHFNFPDYSEPFGNKQFPLQKISGFEDMENSFRYLNEADNENILNTFAVFYSICSKLYPKLKFDKTVKLDERIKKSVEYINSNYNRYINVDTLAQISNMSMSRFYHHFKNELGITPIEYKNNLAIKNAALLLTNKKQLSIEEISSQCGFESSSYFRRVFRAATGKSPREYRKTMSDIF